ncbi:putative 6-phosphogluconolactonase-like enzyme [metagenome]|uniref:Putative 6-phosphogluconolactonase-like enzyme n=1 Tax=metagenome TaxID=256318 RepID=A0A2P2CC34_9ZZZZ
MSLVLVGVGSELQSFEVDVETGEARRLARIDLGLNPQYACWHPDRPVLYVAASSRKDATRPGARHEAVAVAVNELTGSLGELGERATLPDRPNHVYCSEGGDLLALSIPGTSCVRLSPIERGGALGKGESTTLSTPSHTHQVRATPRGDHLIAVSRGNPSSPGWWAHKGRQREPGAISILGRQGGQWHEREVAVVGDGYDFGPRHVEFHPSSRWMYVSVETQNEVMAFQWSETAPHLELVQRLSTLTDDDRTLVHHGAGAIHVHPRGHVVYVSNRSHKSVPHRDGSKSLREGLHENSLLVFAVDPASGTLTLRQRIDSGGVCPRTFSIDPSGRLLVVANAESRWWSGPRSRLQGANLTSFRVHDDGRLSPLECTELDGHDGARAIWSGIYPRSRGENRVPSYAYDVAVMAP